MRSAWIEAERVGEVRRAARDWKKAGVIGESTLAAIETEFPYPRIELARAWRVLVLVLVSVAILGIQLGIFGFDARGSARYFVYAAVLAAATEVLRGSRLAGTGSDAATSFWTVVNLLIGVGVLFDAKEATLVSAVACVAFAVACWRWGFAIYGAFAAAAGFLFLARSPYGRLGWAIAGALLCIVSARLAGRARLTPSRRRAFAGVFVVSALAVYGAVNLYSRDERLVEAIGLFAEPRRFVAPPSGARSLFAAATALLPVLFLAWGIRARRRLALDTGALLAALSVLTLHYYFRFGSIPITVFGLALIGFALWLNRLLTRAPDGEVSGFTASPLLSADSGAIAPAAALVAAGAAPASPGLPHRDDDPFSPGGGRYGGGGASGTFD
ncbi:MAG TPA: hypothetical protein VFF17_05205 [Thermoanaerobaculia bacterium]|nr:hypothetical protein [Thermoanaerobaculia bacterium]